MKHMGRGFAALAVAAPVAMLAACGGDDSGSGGSGSGSGSSKPKVYEAGDSITVANLRPLDPPRTAPAQTEDFDVTVT